MKKRVTQRQLIIFMVSLSVLVYFIHYIIFRDIHHIFKFFLHELAFVPLEVILVTLVFERMIRKTHDSENRTKQSMIESTFFSESGLDILNYFISCDSKSHTLCQALNITPQWESDDFNSAKSFIDNYAFEIDSDKIDFFGLHYHLNDKRSYYLKIIENPALGEGDTFTHLMMGMYYLWEELDHHTDLYDLPRDERARLVGVANDIYMMLTLVWLDNAAALVNSKSPRVSGLIRTNPFTRANALKIED